MNMPASSIRPLLASENAFGFCISIKIIVLSRFPKFLSYHGFLRRAVESSRIDLDGKMRKKKPISLSRRHFLQTFVHSANNRHDRLSHLFHSSLALSLGGKGSRILALLLLFIKPACKRAGNHRRSFFSWSRRALTPYSPFLRDASESIFKTTSSA